MKILFPEAYFTPENTASTYMEDNRFERFSKEGFQMVVFAPLPTRGVNKNVQKHYQKLAFEKMYNDAMIVYRFRLWSEGNNPLLRAIRYFFLCIKLFYKCVFSEDARSCDVMFVTSTPPIIGISAGWIKKKVGIRIIYNLQDIFPDSLVGTGLAKKGGLLWKIGRKIEDYTYRNADKIIVISEDFKKNIMAKGVPEDKIVVIYNWVDENAVVDVPRSENGLFDKYGLERDKFYITYSGNIGLTQNLDLLLEVAEELDKEAPDIQFVIIGDGAYKQTLEKQVSEKHISNITFLPFQPYQDISLVFSLGDVGLVISKPGVGANSVPSKTWSIMSASRPVLANFDENELKMIIEENNCGIFSKAGDKKAFKASILQLYRDRALAVEMGQNGRHFILENLTRDQGTQKYVDVIKSFER
jgi:glycosyltransferase involved in cell wall biosynthesis